MGLLSGLLGIATGGISSFWTGGKDKKKKEPTLSDLLAPYLKEYSETSKKYSAAADEDYAQAGRGFDDVESYLRKIMGGSRNDLLATFDASELTKGLDEQQMQNYELAPRGGRRAATSANAGFDKFANLNAMLQQIRSEAPDKLFSLAQAIANMGQGKLSAAMSGTQGGSNLVLGIEQARLQEKQAKSDLLGGIFSAIGTTVGLLACNTLDTWILMADGKYKQLREVRVGDKVLTPIGFSGQFEEAKVIRKEVLENQKIYTLKVNGSYLKGTASHMILDADEEELEFIRAESLDKDIELPLYLNEKIQMKKLFGFNESHLPETVAILKLNDEKQNYRYITNSFISVDADCK